MASVNLPNVLTVGRILLVPVVVAGLLVGSTAGSIVAAIAYALAAASDVIDGRVARSREIVTTFGKVVDPVADKLLVIAALVALVSLDRLAAWVAGVIVAREVAVTALRVAVQTRGSLIPASVYGKAKTVVQTITVFVLILAPDPSAWWVDALVGLAVAVTVLSGVDYFLNMRGREPLPPKASRA